jgi:hypothetical protein
MQIAKLIVSIILLSSASEVFSDYSTDMFSIKTEFININIPEFLVVFCYSFLLFLLVISIIEGVNRFFCIQYAKRALGFHFDIDQYYFDNTNSSFFASGISIKFGVTNTKSIFNSLGGVFILIIFGLISVFISRSIYIIANYCLYRLFPVEFKFEWIINVSSLLIILYTIIIVFFHIIPTKLKYNMKHTRWNLLLRIHRFNEFEPLAEDHWLEKERQNKRP